MTKKTLLKDNSHFAGYTIAGKMSCNHDGEREVYHAVDTAGQEVALTVYNLECGMYHCERVSRKRVPDFIEEINICEQLKSECFPKVLGKGIGKVGRKRLAWMAMEYIDGNQLTNEIMMQGTLSINDSIQIALKLTMALKRLSEITKGGGHYNIRPEMIDSACLRSGRMDEKFYVGLPDTDARKEIFAMELKGRPCDNDIDLELLGKTTSEYTCGDISYIVKETARRCFDEALRNGDGTAVPLTTGRLLEVAKSTIPSVSPKEIRLYQELKEKMEHRDKENKMRGHIGFSTNS